MNAHEAAARDLELVFALAGPVGSDLQEISRTLGDALKRGEYTNVEEIGISKLIADIARHRPLTRTDESAIALAETPEEERISSYMDAGNAIRRLCSDDAALASAAMAEIRGRRTAAGGKPSRRAYIIRSLKRPEEVNILRRVYGTGFFLIGVNVSMPDRVKALAAKIAGCHGETSASAEFEERLKTAESLATRDEEESRENHGQRLRDVFQLCDLFVSPASTTSLFEQIYRFVRLILGDLAETPWRDEQFMYHAFAASLASGALGRQVGATLVSRDDEVLGIGWNEVPKGGGGLYRAGDHIDHRDIRRDRDSVNVHGDQIIEEIIAAARDAGWLTTEKEIELEKARAVFRKSRVMNLLEFGRTTHAEMEAVLAAARAGTSVRNATLYTTTFPCHECARLIVTAGISRVVYIEPYPKSKALDLHADAIRANDAAAECIVDGCESVHQVTFEPFVGIGPHRYADLFSITTSTGIVRDRKSKETGERIVWDPKRSLPKVEMLPMSYLDLEAKALAELRKFIGPAENDA